MGDSPPRSERPRSRSRSPPRRSAKSGSSGFRWKEKRGTADDDDDRRGLDRGYRNRSPRRHPDRERDRDGDRARDTRDDRYKPDRERDSRRDRDAPRDKDAAPRKDRDRDPEKRKAPKPKPAPAPTSGGEEMIVITVNDRLGTKAQIPCFPSDKIKDLRVLVAAQVGRKPHEILLKRQGERPFKDQLSLEDYGISSGVQLDLEVDTGD